MRKNFGWLKILTGFDSTKVAWKCIKIAIAVSDMLRTVLRYFSTQKI